MFLIEKAKMSYIFTPKCTEEVKQNVAGKKLLRSFK